MLFPDLFELIHGRHKNEVHDGRNNKEINDGREDRSKVKKSFFISTDKAESPAICICATKARNERVNDCLLYTSDAADE